MPELPLQTVVTITAATSAVLAIVVLMLLIRIGRMPIVTPFTGKAATGGRTLSQVLPANIPGFSRVDKLPYFTSETAFQVSYRGAGATIQLTAVNAGNRQAALSTIKRTRRGRTRNTFVSANLRGSHPYVMKRTETERVAAWVNQRWAFVARSADPLALEQFIESFPF